MRSVICVAICFSLSGCVAHYPPCTPRPDEPAGGGRTWQYVPEYTPPAVTLPGDEYFDRGRRAAPPLGGPYFSMPPAESPGLKVTPFIGPDGVALCNEVNGVTVCQ